MKVEEQNEQLHEELRRLRCDVATLTSRVEHLETQAGVDPASVLPAGEEREGDFGPAVKREAPDRHRSTVAKALSMIGVLPAETHTAPTQTTHSVQRALHKARTLGQEDAGQEERDENWIPLPELRQDLGEDGFEEADAAPVELGNAIPVNLRRRWWTKPIYDVGFLLVEIAFFAGVFVWLPGVWGVLAAVPLVALLSAPWWGYLRPLLHAHARFFSLVVMVRCLMPDIVTMGMPDMWLNPRFFTMLTACLPALWLVARGRHGWAVQAFAMAAVLGCAVGAEFGSWAVALSIAGIVFGAAITLRNLPAREVSTALPRAS